MRSDTGSNAKAKVKRIVLPALAVVFTVACSTVNAQSLVKRASCASAAEGYGLGVYFNTSGFTQYVMVQVTRDGCRPKDNGASFGAWTTNSNGSQLVGEGGVSMRREGRSTWAVQRSVVDDGVLRIWFSSNSPGTPVRGTFDYTLQAD